MAATSPSKDEVVVDLSRHINKLAAYEDISMDLSKDEEAQLVLHIKRCMELSYQSISKRYPHWREADRAHDVYVPPEATKFREKAVISDTRAITDTVLTYAMAALTGRNPMFQLEGLNRKSRKASAILERLLHQHMRRGAGEVRLAQLLLDSIRYGFAPTKVVWNDRKKTNHIGNYDPRRAFPDPRVQWGDWEDMAFMIFTDLTSTNTLIASGMYRRVKEDEAIRRAERHIGSWRGHQYILEEGKGFNINPSTPNSYEPATTGLRPARLKDEAWLRLCGYEIGIPSIEQIWITATVLDEQHIINLQLNPNGQEFPMVIGGLFFDRHKTYSQSLYDLMLPLHEIATWLLRSRIDNVQAALNNLIFADPAAVSIGDLINRNPWGVVRTLPGTKPGEGVYIAQVPDVTKSHWQDIGMLGDLKQRLTAASDAQQGMPTSDGIRSATEINRLTQLGSQRLGVLSRVMSATTVRPLVRMMVGNIQDAIDYQDSIRIEEGSQGILTGMIEDGYMDVAEADLQGQIDYLVIDGTLPVEPTRNAETWMGIIKLVNETGLNMEYKTGKMVEEAIRSMGVSDLDQFKISQKEMQQGPTPSQQLSLMEKLRGANVQPNEDVARQVERGNLIPFRQAAA